jgi:hypothetical protein
MQPIEAFHHVHCTSFILGPIRQSTGRSCLDSISRPPEPPSRVGADGLVEFKPPPRPLCLGGLNDRSPLSSVVQSWLVAVSAACSQCNFSSHSPHPPAGECFKPSSERFNQAVMRDLAGIARATLKGIAKRPQRPECLCAAAPVDVQPPRRIADPSDISNILP